MAESTNQNLPSTSKQQPSHETICLETHTWHAKRFHMIDKWGYKIPNYSKDESFTASYGATIKDCLLQDISYYTCIEIVGEKNLLEATLKEHCNPTKTFAEKMYTCGQVEGTVMFFKKNGYPQFPIGCVNFFWKLSQTDIKTIWIWVHPAFYSDFLSEIISSFEFKQNNAEKDRADISHNLTDLYINDTGFEMRVLKYALNRFRLCRPAALTVLKEALRVPSLTELDLDSENCPMTEEQDSMLRDENLDTSTDSNFSVPLVEKMIVDENEKDTKDLTMQDLKEKTWHTKYYKERENVEAFKIQEKMWQSMNVLGLPRFLPSNMIIALTVCDPRFYLPVRRMRTEIPLSVENLLCQLPTGLSRSPIWDAQIRQIVSNSCVSTNSTDKSMGAASMSDDPHFNKDAVAKIPILLIKKPVVASLGSHSRMDIIIPSRWAMAFWNALIMQSSLVGGLRENKLVVFEGLGTHIPDINDPDTPAYKREALKRKKKLTNRYFSNLPFQRVIFIKFGIRSPFFCDWKNLTRGWSDAEDFYVLRHCRLLALLRAKIKTVERKNARSKSTVEESKFDFQEFDEYKNCLVQVKLSVMSERTTKEFAIICMPTDKDWRRFKYNENYDGPVEKYHTDPNKNPRMILFKLYSMQMKQLRRDRVKLEKTFRDVLPEEFSPIQDEIHRKHLESRKTISDDFAERIRKWYLPKSAEVRHSCDREVMGYVTIGSYSLLRGKGICIGYVTLPSLLKIIRKKSDIVLVRNTKDLQYRLARLEILVDINDKYW